MAQESEPQRTKGSWRTVARLSLDAIRANSTGRLALKVVIAILGAIVVIVGIALIPLPGPGWLIVLAGLAIWAVEFVWARSLLGFTRDRLRSWTSWIRRQSLPVQLLIGAIGLLFVAAIVLLTLKLSFGVDIISLARTYFASH